jgi:glutamine amidotransferase
MIGLIDYGSGNLRSVEKALCKVGAQVQLVRDPNQLQAVGGVVLPGVGAFDDCINALQRQGLLEPLRAWILGGRLFLGICVGYQALFERSQEFNSQAAGLGIFKGTVVRFKDQPGLKVPQIGWNQLEIVQPDCPLYRGIESGAYVYFVHSFFPEPEDPSIVATYTVYGQRFASSIWSGNVFATQFHPEKSQTVGLQLLQNFVRLLK